MLVETEAEWVTEAVEDLYYGECTTCGNTGAVVLPVRGTSGTHTAAFACRCIKAMKYAGVPKATEEQLFEASCQRIEEGERLKRWAEDRGINFKGTDDQSRASFRAWFESVGSTGAMFAKGR